ncbi:copper resistance system multicopper oxidase [Sphingobium sp. JS3065]|uniref:copper resistance system multicopper oxidase n=1 Tax=Sphingobium sp. JS3065 TaxID=2970925 RepID=UPI0022653C49|nr:copper resistance system multicopper oxidase [Sphingobium sp. JS3065]UZW55708.1 copper resistance system multicopper oxidase [Sphingobium sp. JS3065]
MTSNYASVPGIDRRALLRGAGLAGSGFALAAWMPAWAQPVSRGIARPVPQLSGDTIALRVAHEMVRVDGRDAHVIAMNGTVPAPLLRLREGQKVRITVDNALDEETSVHWHGLLVPFQMDGVPGVSFPGIKPHSSFTYEFQLEQSGTYWYHSHSGLQEAMGHYGPIVIDPKDVDPIAYDREHVVVFSDHSFIHPHTLFTKLKQESGYFNRQKQTLAGLAEGKDQTHAERLEWARMRMDPTDILDVTGSVYTYVVNGYGPNDNWTALFEPGERVRLRFINASAMTIFNVRIPGLRMTVVAADGLPVRPVPVDELQMTIAETYDVIVTPTADRPYTIVGEAADRSGLARATLAPRPGMAAEVPPLRARPLLTMKDMGMGGMDTSVSDDPHAGHDMAGMDMPATGSGAAGQAGAAGHSMSMRDGANAPQVVLGPGVQSIAPMPVDRTGEPGVGLENVDHKVLVYRDLVALERNPDERGAAREIEVHLTGNMERYMWSMDGKTLSEAKTPIALRTDERVRVTLINDTMMNHPIHLHGHFFELVTGHGAYSPRKHTVNVAPGGKVSFDVTGIHGDWAFHCHMFLHMHAGMMRVVQVRDAGDAA